MAFPGGLLRHLYDALSADPRAGIACGKGYTDLASKTLQSVGMGVNFYTGELPLLGARDLLLAAPLSIAAIQGAVRLTQALSLKESASGPSQDQNLMPRRKLQRRGRM